MFPNVAVPAVCEYPWIVSCPAGGIGSPIGVLLAVVVPPAAYTVPDPVLMIVTSFSTSFAVIDPRLPNVVADWLLGCQMRLDSVPTLELTWTIPVSKRGTRLRFLR